MKRILGMVESRVGEWAMGGKMVLVFLPNDCISLYGVVDLVGYCFLMLDLLDLLERWDDL